MLLMIAMVVLALFLFVFGFHVCGFRNSGSRKKRNLMEQKARIDCILCSLLIHILVLFMNSKIVYAIILSVAFMFFIPVLVNKWHQRN